MQTVGLIHTLEQCLNRMQTVGLIHTLEQCLNRMQTVGLIHTLEQCLNRMQTSQDGPANEVCSCDPRDLEWPTRRSRGGNAELKSPGGDVTSCGGQT
ncbi:hypothetical protein AAFF_G00298110 [Aldrovandia affinis]|uniref:Uncharacterized protein n=1 Tax=Aldrovandia affinis TaxID=143900 RepID=A0AAD7W1Q1_9TELE|nr:hypothetical protein AAFF_G00298110 [Aldrovandia affinis]